MVLLDGRMCSPANFKRSAKYPSWPEWYTYVDPVSLLLLPLPPSPIAVIAGKVLFLKVGIINPLMAAHFIHCLLHHNPVTFSGTLEDGVAFHTARLPDIRFGGRSL